MMQVSELEELAHGLQGLRDRLRQSALPHDRVLDEGHPLVQAAKACAFMLPEPLTAGALAETVDRKIENVALLLERAREHEDLPDTVRIAAEQEDLLEQEGYRNELRQARSEEQRQSGG